MPEISIIMPSLRPDALSQTLGEFSITDKDSDYEIVVVSPFEVRNQDRVVHMYEEEPQGNNLANDIGYKNSSGQYIIAWSDDSSPTPNCLSNMLAFVKSKEEPFIGAFRVKDQLNQEHSNCCVYDKLYAAWGCASRNTVNMIGGHYDPIFKSHWSDPDMSLRVWAKGGKVEICPNAWVIKRYIEDEVHKSNYEKYFNKDMETFFNRWHNTLGSGIKRDFHSVNKPIFIGVKPIR